MVFITDLTGSICLVSFCLLLLGFYRPWVVLWWEDIQNRKKVIRVYGSIALITFLIYLVLHFYFSPDSGYQAFFQHVGSDLNSVGGSPFS